jgi:hypothetical protein
VVLCRLVVAQLTLAGGLLGVKHHYTWVAAVALPLGIIVSAFSKAGISVLQHSCLALVLPCANKREAVPSATPADSSGSPLRLLLASASDGLLPPPSPRALVVHGKTPSADWAADAAALAATRAEPVRGAESAKSASRPRATLVAGLCIMVGTTHAIGSFVAFAAPRILSACGLIGLQTALALPSLVSAAAAAALGLYLPRASPCAPPTPTPRRRAVAPFPVACTGCGLIVRRSLPYGAICDRCRERACCAIGRGTSILKWRRPAASARFSRVWLCCAHAWRVRCVDVRVIEQAPPSPSNRRMLCSALGCGVPSPSAPCTRSPRSSSRSL